MAPLTPMMKQYFQIKENYPDAILFFRLGDFYEMFFDDAITASRELDIVLTGRDCGQEERAPMCGIPFHAAEQYLTRLVNKGYKVAICEQLENPTQVKGMVKRDVIRVVTPGTIFDSNALDEKKNNYVCALICDENTIGAAFADITTGELNSACFSGVDAYMRLMSEMAYYRPREIIQNDRAFENKELAEYVSSKIPGCLVQRMDKSLSTEHYYECICRQFKVDSVEKVGFVQNSTAASAVGVLLNYLMETQKTELSHILEVRFFREGEHMELDPATRRNLELCETMRDRSKKGTLLWVLDDTCTSMGARLLRRYVEQPLVNSDAIRRRLDAVTELVESTILREELRSAMSPIRDMERLLSKVACKTANCRDLAGLKISFAQLPAISSLLHQCKSNLLSSIALEFDDLSDLCSLIDAAIVENPPISLREGNLIRDGYHDEVDQCRYIMREGKNLILSFEQEEKERTGIKNLKVSYNKVYGYYIEVSKSNLDMVPPEYVRKQTIVNGERYITEPLKEIETKVLGSSERLAQLEYEIFCQIRDVVYDAIDRIQNTARLVAQLDAISSLASAAVKNGYVKPIVDDSGEIVIQDGRHPVVEQMSREGLFVPNDTNLDYSDHRFMIITGPNMAGKSTYMRQVALITLMAQIGSYVPAKMAKISVVDRIFTRVGASDDLAAGQSTFMVEMSEVAHILRNATKHSLIILDEIGRGTSTYDGLSIAWSVVEYLSDIKRIGAKTLFATHYHELTRLEGMLDGVKNYCIAVKKRGDEIIFLRKIVRGGADDSYGVEVAKLAGVPDDVIERAKEMVEQFENGKLDLPAVSRTTATTSESSVLSEKVRSMLREADLSVLTPIEALNYLYRLQQMLNEEEE